jgi:hypothetical protein
MTFIHVAIAAAVLIIPSSAFAAANEVDAVPVRSVAEQVSPIAEPERTVTQDPARESEALARAPSAPPKPKAVRQSKLSVVRAAPAAPPNSGCLGYWCGRQFVLMLGVGY